MRRKLFLFIVFLACAQSLASARLLPDGPLFDRFRAGVEWGYTQCFFRSRDYNFYSEEGYRIYEQDRGFHWSANAQVLARVSYALGNRSLMTLLGGYMGMGENNRLFPVQLRYSYFPKTFLEDGLFAFAQGGVAWHTHAAAGQPATLGAAGGGYRLHLSEDCNLDLLIGFKYLRDHPAIPNPEGPGNVPAHNIRKNVAGYCALDISLALSF